VLSLYGTLQVQRHCCASVFLTAPLFNTAITFARSLITSPLTSHSITWWLVPDSPVSSPCLPCACESRSFHLKCPGHKRTLLNILQDCGNVQEPQEPQQYELARLRRSLSHLFIYMLHGGKHYPIYVVFHHS